MANHLQRILLFLCLFFIVCTGSGYGADRSLFSVEEQHWLDNHATISVVVNGGPPPIFLWTGPPPKRKLLQESASPEPIRRFSPPPPPPRRMPGMHRPSGHPPRFQGSLAPPPQPYDSLNIPSGSPDRNRSERPNELLVPVAEDEQQYFQGLAADYLKEVAVLTGITFKTTLFSANNQSAAIDALARDEADLTPATMCGQPPVASVHLSSPYLRTPVVVVMRSGTAPLDDISSIQSMKLAGLLSVPRKLQALGLDVHVQQVSPFEGLQGVATGKFDAFLGERTAVYFELKQDQVANVGVVGELPAPMEFCIGVSSRMAGFLPIFDKAVAAIPQEKRDEILRKWLGEGFEKQESPPKKRLWLAGLLGALAFLLGCFGLFYYRRRLQGIRKGIAALEPHLLCAQIDQNITITGVTEALCKATGYTENDLTGKSLQVLGAPPVGGKARLARLLDAVGQGQTWEGEVKLTRKDGTNLWTDVIISPSRRKNDTIGYSIIYQDASRRKHYEKLAVRDELTGLYNRRHFNSQAPNLLQKAAREGHLFGLFLLDIDNFKKFNDTYGHPAGDEVLATIGRTLKSLFKRDEDLSFRLGGEEFGIVTLFAAKEDAVAIARKILTSVRSLNIEHKQNPPGRVTVSIGVAVTRGEGAATIDDIYKRADSRLYKAKQTGRNKCVL